MIERNLFLELGISAHKKTNLVSGMDGVPISWGMKGKRLLYFLVCSVVLTGMSRVVSAQAINCSSGFNTTSTADGGCGISVNGQAADFWIGNHPSSILSGSSAILAPSHAGHLSNSLIKQVAVNNQAFTTSFRFVPNGLNVAFILENDLNPGAGQYPFIFAAGAGGEGGLSQFAGGSNIPPSHVFALMLDQYSPLVNDGSGQFTYSSAQIYQTLQVTGGVQSLAGYLPEYPINKISTSPVALNAPANAQATTTGHTYSATINYDGYTLTLNLFDVTAGGSCPGANCFTHTWTGVYIPEITGATTAYAGLVAGTSGAGGGAPNPLLIDSFTYAATTPTGAPSFTAWNANSTYNIGTVSAASPVYSVAPGTYPGTQTVAISTSTSPHNYICYLLSSTTPALYPQPDNNGGCSTGTLYTTPISIASTATLYAMAGSNNAAFPLGSVAPPGLGPPSTLVAATYTIAASSVAATPTFSPAGGAYSSTQSVTLSDQSPGAVIYYTTDGSAPSVSSNRYLQPLNVDSSQTLRALAVLAGSADSPSASATFVISSGIQIPSLTFSPSAGTYAAAQVVTINNAPTGADLYYTTDGTTPTASSSKYSGPVKIASTETLKAIAVAADHPDGVVAAAAYSISPAVFDFSAGFKDHPSAVVPVGDAHYSASSIQLTSLMSNAASNAYFTQPVNVKAFSTTFTWSARCPSVSSGNGCGDGFGFVIISTSNPNSPSFWSGSPGGNLSWASECTFGGSCEPIKSVMVKFDLYDNVTGKPGVNLTGYYTGGEYPQAPHAQYDMAPAGIKIQDGHIMQATLTYDGAVLREKVTDTATNTTYTNQYTTNIPELVGGDTALVGFAGGTGGARVQQNIRSWIYTAAP